SGARGARRARGQDVADAPLNEQRGGERAGWRQPVSLHWPPRWRYIGDTRRGTPEALGGMASYFGPGPNVAKVRNQFSLGREAARGHSAGGGSAGYSGRDGGPTKAKRGLSLSRRSGPARGAYG